MESDTETLLTLLKSYLATRTTSHSECQSVRMADVLTQLDVLSREYDVSFRRVDNPDDPLVVVCFYHAPISRWADQTYATCLGSLITTFFNPHCVLPSSAMAAKLQPGEEPVLSDDEVSQLQLLFGGVLKYIHCENVKLGQYMNQLQTHFYPDKKAWRKCNPRTIYDRVLDMWSASIKDIDRLARSPDDKKQLFESIMNRDAELLRKGLTRISKTPEKPFPWVLTLALMQYQCSRNTTLSHEMALRALELSEAEKQAEEERKRTGEHGCTDEELVSLDTQIKQTIARKGQAEQDEKERRAKELREDIDRTLARIEQEEAQEEEERRANDLLENVVNQTGVTPEYINALIDQNEGIPNADDAVFIAINAAFEQSQ